MGKTKLPMEHKVIGFMCYPRYYEVHGLGEKSAQKIAAKAIAAAAAKKGIKKPEIK